MNTPRECPESGRKVEEDEGSDGYPWSAVCPECGQHIRLMESGRFFIHTKETE